MITSTVEPDQVKTCVGIKPSENLKPSIYLVQDKSAIVFGRA
ncbi:hypothetical protein J633_2543 [Acinetobacter sp. 216872]|nr:hypothetical protein J633_2543 [Acinetobacter sp. 216872]PRV97568.1 hypothetical protein CSB87_2058 [Acinetobacter sp. AR_0276]